MKKLVNKKVTLSIDSSTYEAFQKYCEDNAIMLSKKIELWMKQELETRAIPIPATKKEPRPNKGGQP